MPELPTPTEAQARLAAIGQALQVARTTQDHLELTPQDRALLRGAATALGVSRLVAFSREADGEPDPVARAVMTRRLFAAIAGLPSESQAAVTLSAIVALGRTEWPRAGTLPPINWRTAGGTS